MRRDSYTPLGVACKRAFKAIRIKYPRLSRGIFIVLKKGLFYGLLVEKNYKKLKKIENRKTIKKLKVSLFQRFIIFFDNKKISLSTDFW